MIVGLDLEGYGPALGQPQHACVFTGTLHHLGPASGKGLQNRPGVLVGAVLRPECGEDPQLGEGWSSAQDLEDAAVFELVKVVLPHQFGGDQPFSRSRDNLAGRAGDAGDRQYRSSDVAASWCEETGEVKNPAPPVRPSSRSIARSGCGIIPTTFPSAFEMPAM